MKQTTKRKIAKEIVIIFICAVLIGLTWGIFWTINEFQIKKTKKLEEKTSTLSHDIDSIQATFSKSTQFEKMLDIKNVPTEYFNKGRPPLILLPEIIIDESSIQQASFVNERRLFLLLQKLNSPFDMDSIDIFAKFGGYKVNPFSKSKEPIPIDTLKSISEKFETDFPEKEELRRYYEFLKSKNCITADFKEFCFTMQGLPLPPSLDALTIYEKDRTALEEASKDLIKTKQRIKSTDDMQEIAKWISILILTIVYPVRFLILLLTWAVKTLKQNVT